MNKLLHKDEKIAQQYTVTKPNFQLSTQVSLLITISPAKKIWSIHLHVSLYWEVETRVIKTFQLMLGSVLPTYNLWASPFTIIADQSTLHPWWICSFFSCISTIRQWPSLQAHQSFCLFKDFASLLVPVEIWKFNSHNLFLSPYYQELE